MRTRTASVLACAALTLPAAAQGGSDACATPEPVFGSSASVDVDMTNATTGPEGQGYPACHWGGTSGLDNDVWFLWTAPESGVVDMHVVGGNYTTDPRLAVYLGNSCAALPPLECNDDGVGLFELTPWVRFEATAGAEYLIQVGLFPGSLLPPAVAQLRWWTTPLAPEYGYVYDDGKQDGGGLTLLQNGEIAWLQRYNAYGGADTIHAVWSSFGALDGATATAYVWDDPDDDGLPDDAVLLASATTQIRFAGTDTLARIPFAVPVAVDRKFFVGVSVPIPANSPMVEVDDHEFPNWSWLASQTAGPFDAGCLSCNSSPPVLLRELNIEGAFLLRAEGSGGLIATYCSAPPPGWGWCYPRMQSSGSPSFLGGGFSTGAYDVAPDRAGLLFWSPTQARIPFKGNLKCVANPARRTPLQRSGSSGAPPCSGAYSFDWTTAYMTTSGIAPGQTVYVQHWFREPASPATTGFSEALSFVVLP